MEYSQWVEMQQQNPNPNSNASTVHAANYTHNVVSDPYQPPAFDPHNALFLPQPQPQPPGVDPPYVPPQYVQPPATVSYAQQPIGYEPQQNVDAAAAAAAAAYYYPDPNVNWAAAYPQIGAVNYAAGTSTPNLTNQLQRRHPGKKGPKKTKVVQSAWCEVCKIDCNSSGVLDQHKLGKKHLKNLEKLKAKLAPAPAAVLTATATTPAVIVDPSIIVAAPPAAVAASTSSGDAAAAVAPIIGPEENPEKSSGQKSRKRSAARREDLETKKQRVLAGGADAESVHACDICNVVCNSATVFNYHLAGKIHASSVKKQALKTAAALKTPAAAVAM
ncbi:hypothetical protein ACS0TY_028448 [Phlomoides rotata]